MLFPKKLKHKLLLFWLGSVLVSLLLLSVIFSVLATNLFEQRAHSQIQNGFNTLSQWLSDYSSHMEESATALSQQHSIVASTNLISNYQDSTHYQPEIFDSEKKFLLDELTEAALRNSFDLVALYDPKWNLLAFHASSGEGKYQSGYTTYLNGAKAAIINGGAPTSLEKIGKISPFLYLDPSDLITPDSTVHAHATDNGIILEVYTPIKRQFANGSQEIVGMLKVGNLLSSDFVNTLTKLINLEFSFALDNGNLIGNPLSNSSLHLAFDAPSLLTDGTAPINWLQIPHGEHFLGAMSYPLEGNKKAVFLIHSEKAYLASGIEAFKQSALLVLILAAFPYIPLGIYVLHRTVSTPISQLVEKVETVEQGDYEALKPSIRQDELGFLSNSINNMAFAIHKREGELKKLSRAVEQSPVAVAITSPDGTIEYINPRFCEVTGYSPEEIIGNSHRMIQSNRTPVETYQELWNTITQGNTWNGTLLNKKKDGTLYWESVSISSIKNEDNSIANYVSVREDITQRKLIEEERLRFRRALDTSIDCIFLIDPDRMRFIDFNETALKVMGFSREEFLNLGPHDIKPEYSRAQLQTYFNETIHSKDQYGTIVTIHECKDGQRFPVEVQISAMEEKDGTWLIIALAHDITERKKAERRIAYQTNYDALTALPNRRLLHERLEIELGRAKRKGHIGAILYIDLDKFKIINDSLGHQAGNDLIKHVATCLENCIKEENSVARIGGDEFAALIPELCDTEDEAITRLQTAIQEIQATLATPYQIVGHELQLTASIGIATFPLESNNADDILAHADIAMYRAKDRGRNTFQFYTPSMQLAASEHLAMDQKIRNAIQNEQFCLYYQPQITDDGCIIGVECLIRWQHPEDGMIPPDKFIPIAEESEFILAIGEWVLRTGCRQLAEWQRQDSPNLPRSLAVNVSPKQFKQQGFVDQVTSILAETGADASGLELEVTEGLLISNLEEATEKMNALRALGIQFSIDDFGTGYSSLSYLKQLPVNTLKIDRSFVSDITNDPSNAAIVDTIIAMARHLDLEVVAEGVETEEELSFLQEKGCKIYQGYYFSRPLPIDEFNQFSAKL